jgi:ketosteroid isomerase-like protein
MNILLATALALTLREEIVAADKGMFDAFNTQNLPVLMSFFSEDLEFYHDKGGLTGYADAQRTFKENFGKGLGLRRDLVEGSLEVYPIPSYGAMEIGAHRFCHVEDGKKECAVFKFVHVWKKQEGKWKVTRVVSYGH